MSTCINFSETHQQDYLPYAIAQSLTILKQNMKTQRNLLAAHHDIFQAICLLHTTLFFFLTFQAMVEFNLMTNAPINWRVEENIERKKVRRPTAQIKLAVQQVEQLLADFQSA